MIVLIYNLIVLAPVLGGLAVLWRLKGRHSVPVIVLAAGAIGVVGLGAASHSPMGPFGKLQLLAWMTFLHVPLFLAGAAVLLFRHRRWLAWVCVGLVICIGAVACDAFLIEPRWLEVTRLTIPTDKLSAPLRIAVIADVQTDAPGPYEERAFQLAMAEQPDLILLPGDHLHVKSLEEYFSAKAALKPMLQRLHAPLGVYAVRGNMEADDWAQLFAGLPVTVVEGTATFDLGPVVVTALSFIDSADVRLSVPPQQKYHIVLGHMPDFSMGAVNADLLVAGHTHGGQVCLPLIGPVLTWSRVPRAWASGTTEIAPGKVLVVSRGVGVERGDAPPMRFLCRPQLVILNLVPAE